MKRITFLKKGISLVCAILMLTAVLPTALAAEYTSDDCYVEGYDTSVEIVEEGAVLLKNANGILPLQDGAKVTLLGSMSYNYVGGDDDNTVMMDAAFIEAGLDVNMQAWNWLETMCGGKRGVRDADPSGLGDWDSYAAIHEFPIEEYEKAKSEILVEGYCDTAIVTLSRTAAEGSALSMDLDGDGSTVNGTTYLELDDNERNLMKFCKENFKHTIVLLNTSSAMEIGFLDSEEYNVEACLWIGHPGDAGLVGVGKLITGAVNPSGRLVDTWAYDVSTNPTFYNMDNNRYANGQDADNNTFYQYEEGIYVGYRYYETRGETDGEDWYNANVVYPFGYGLSYTTFNWTVGDASASEIELGTTITVPVTVKNTGSVAGKDVYIVDYSDLNQAPDDFKDCTLKGIVDHHKLGDMTSSAPLEIVIMPVGCTNTILKRMYDYLGFVPPKNIAGAMLCAILSDTVIFKSPTCTPADKAAAAELAEIAGIKDIEALGMELFTAKSAVKGVAARDLIMRDFKDFNMSGSKVGIGQLELVDLKLLEDRIPELLADLAALKAEGRHTAILLLTDIMKEGSLLLMVSDDPAKIAGAFGTTAEGTPWLPGVMSRKKQVVPNLEAAFKA